MLRHWFDPVVAQSPGPVAVGEPWTTSSRPREAQRESSVKEFATNPRVHDRRIHLTTATSNALRMWDSQSTAAERMCADILRLEGFQNVDPQSPLGGPDGGKDILCDKDGIDFIAACHFSNKDLSFTAIKKKFSADLKTALQRGRKGFIFMTNQLLTPGYRNKLEVLAGQKGQRCLIFHREYLRVVLDSPQGYGLRLRHLDLGLTPEEQSAFFATADASTAAALTVHTRAINRLTGQVTRIARAQLGFMVESFAVVVDAVRADKPASNAAAIVKASGDAARRSVEGASEQTLSGRLSSTFVCYLHRLLMPADQFAGQFRQTQVWLIDPTGKSKIDLECPSWDKVPTLVEELLSQWNMDYAQVAAATETEAVLAMARFFYCLQAIHPFLDGNGRLARALLSLQARELIGLKEDLLLERGADYYAALKSVDGGDFVPLQNLIAVAVADVKRATT
jgi:fido (protein-threonine AMPylation protein)